MELRKVTANDDFAAIGSIYSTSWKTAYQGIVPQSYLDELNGNFWSSALSEREYNAFVILDGSKYVGISSICAARDDKMIGWGEISSVYLLPEYFGKGYSKPLLDCAIDALISMGFNKLYLWVLDKNIRAQKFYEKHGFVQNGDDAIIEIGGEKLKEVRYVKHV